MRGTLSGRVCLETAQAKQHRKARPQRTVSANVTPAVSQSQFDGNDCSELCSFCRRFPSNLRFFITFVRSFKYLLVECTDVAKFTVQDYSPLLPGLL